MVDTGALKKAQQDAERAWEESAVSELENAVKEAEESFATWQKRRKAKLREDIRRLREEYDADVRGEFADEEGRRARVSAARARLQDALDEVDRVENRLRNEMLRSGLSAAKLAEYLPERWQKKTGWYAVRKFLE